MTEFFFDLEATYSAILIPVVVAIIGVFGIEILEFFFEPRDERRKYERELKNLNWELEKLERQTKKQEMAD
ncbi:MAG: hypothetical protein HDR27_11255 [Lachnospiraceae bacterium]|nr:hypothetical protein [Lachnospiraceae bacterium]